MRNRRVKSWTNSSFKTREFPERHLRTLVSLMAHRLNLNRGAFFPYYYYYYYSFVFFSYRARSIEDFPQICARLLLGNFTEVGIICGISRFTIECGGITGGGEAGKYGEDSYRLLLEQQETDRDIGNVNERLKDMKGKL